jgi:hypothetical protein
VPIFLSNSDHEDIYLDVRDIVSRKDISIVYTVSVPYNNVVYKIFSVTDTVFEKIEVRSDLYDVDSLEVVEKTIILNKQCSREEGIHFMNALLQYGMFELPEEKDILRKCAQYNSPPERADAPEINFQIVAGDNVRTLNYYNAFKRKNRCSNVEEWDDILKIEDLFYKQWYQSVH